MSELDSRNSSYAVPSPSFGSAVSASRPVGISRAISLILAKLAAGAIFLVSAINPK